MKKNILYTIVSLLFFFFGFISISSCSGSSDSDDISGKVESLNIVSSTQTMKVGDELTLQAEVKDNKGQILDKSVNWTITGSGELSNSFSKKSILTATSEGKITVKIELDGVSSTLDITCSNDPTSSIYDYVFPSKLKNAKITFSWLVLIYKKTDIPANAQRGHERLTTEMSDDQVTTLVNFCKGFEDFTSKYTNGEVGFNLAVAIVDKSKPLSGLYWIDSDKRYGWAQSEDLNREMDTYMGNQSGWFDNIHVIFKMNKNWAVRPSAMYGGGAYMRDNVTRSQYMISEDIDLNDLHVGTWHESIHGLEVQYWLDSVDRGCTRGKSPLGKDIELHGQPDFGYVGNEGANRPETENYFHWMADLTTGNIRDLTTVGWQNYSSASNTNLGFGKNGMYSHGPVRYEYKFKDGGPFPQK